MGYVFFTTHMPWRAVPGENTEFTKTLKGFLRVLRALRGEEVW